MVMLTTTGAEELVQQVSWAIAQYAIYIICNYGGRQANGVLIASLSNTLKVALPVKQETNSHSI